MIPTYKFLYGYMHGYRQLGAGENYVPSPWILYMILIN